MAVNSLHGQGLARVRTWLASQGKEARLIPNQDPKRKFSCFASTKLSAWALAPLSGEHGTEAMGLGLPQPAV